MSKLLMKTLSADLPALAELIRSQGRGRDTVLAHITPQEAALLKKRGGSGSMNPSTGLPEFQEDYSYDIGFGEGVYNPPVEAADIQGADFTPQQVQDYGYTTPMDYYSGGAGGGGFEPAPGMAQDIFQVPEQAYQPFSQLDVGGVYPGGGQAPPATMGIDRSQLEQPSSKSVMDRLGITEKDLPRLGLGALLTGGLSAQNLSRTRQAQQQAQASREELAALGRPYQQTGAELRAAAERGELTPANRQILNAARAQIQQGIANRGGVGVAQAQNQIADLTQRLIQNQFDLGLRISNIGDQYIQGAIRTGLQADQAINSANSQFYSQLASMAAPFILGQQPVYQVTTPVRRG
jgi:hypothetical protein